VQVLIGSVVESWVPLRNLAASVLRLLPWPPPGLDQQDDVLRLVNQSAMLLRSPRPLEADAGAKLLSLVHDCHALQFGWIISLYPVPQVEARMPICDAQTGSQNLFQTETSQFGQHTSTSFEASLHLTSSLLQAVQAAILLAEDDMVAACKQSFSQGNLLALQYVIAQFPWTETHTHGPEVCLCQQAWHDSLYW
jgi:hypothetical protein